jgi:hypothetical protein
LNFNPIVIQPPGTGHSAMEISVSPTALPGTRTITIKGESTDQTKSATVLLTID